VASPLWSLRTPAEFAAVRASDRGVRVGRLVVHRCEGDPGQPVRLGMIVSRQVGNAVVRNLVRRRIRAAVRSVAPQLQGTLIVVRALSGSHEQTFEQLHNQLLASLRPAL
jgi:ribonuclease P protein component